MSVYDKPILLVECDECQATLEYELEYRARDCWSDKGLGHFLRSEHWHDDGDNTHYCPDCVGDHAASTL